MARRGWTTSTGWGGIDVEGGMPQIVSESTFALSKTAR